jgi:hypothetical protein
MLDVLERGTLTLLFRPRINRDQIESIDDVQRLLMLLEPDGRGHVRLIAIGRKRLPRPARHERFWGFVDLVRSRRDVATALGPQTYLTKSHGRRHLAAAEVAAVGSYAVAKHDGHTHLAFDVPNVDIGGNYIVTVMNPDPTMWGFEQAPPLQEELFPEYEVHTQVPTTFPPAIQERFGERRYLDVTPELLDFEGAELVFIATAEEPSEILRAPRAASA